MASELTPKPPADAPLVALVIPLFHHSMLVAEAIQSALDQEVSFPYRVVIVNDGCPNGESERTVLAFAATYPDRISYIRKRNGGLSSARNAGIDFALRGWKSIEAVYFLDADNRLLPHALEKARSQLRASDADWVYPDIDMFGAEINADHRGAYSLLRHLRENFCEAASLVHRRVLEAGVRYDENMKSGYEDWEFWWQAAAKGFRGVYVPDMGLQYRKRPESMLRDAGRDDAAIRTYMRQKHLGALLAPNNLLRLEQDELPRYFLRWKEDNQHVLTTDPGKIAKTATHEEFLRLFIRAIFDPQAAHFPAFLAYLGKEAFEVLKESKLLHWIFWYAEDLLRVVPIVTVTIENSDDQSTFITRTHAGPSGGRHSAADLVFTTRTALESVCRDAGTNWLASLLLEEPEMPITQVMLSLPKEVSTKPRRVQLVNELVRDAVDLRTLYQQTSEHPGSRPTWRTSFLKPLGVAPSIMRDLVEAEPVYPFVAERGDRRNVGFLVPICEFGGVERVALNIAWQLRSLGWRTHLFVVSSGRVGGFKSVLRAFDTINFLADPDVGRFEGPLHWGVRSSSWSDSGNHRRALGLLGAMDVVIHHHAADILHVLRSLQRKGVKTVAHLHLVDKTPEGDSCGHPYLNVAYEHALDAYFVVSEQLRDWLHGMGVPREKLLLVPNAPATNWSQRVVDEVMEERRHRSGPLRLLYLGRLDHQKGLERLALLLRYSAHNPAFTWKLVGDTVLRDTVVDKQTQAFIAQSAEPATYREEILLEHFRWADCIVLPSHYEGVPLTLLEAMRLGVVPLSTDVGAICQVISDGVNGRLFRSTSPTSELLAAMTSQMMSFFADRDALMRMSGEAANAAATTTWRASALAVHAALCALLDSGERTHPQTAPS